MLRKLFILSMSCMVTSQLWAISCYYTLAKNNCWIKYDVTVEVLDAMKNTILTTVTVPAGKLWSRVSFPCETDGQTLMYHARFTPVIWESEKGKVYPAKTFWSLPKQVNPGDSAWNVSVCYPSDFAEVPLPPEATNNCSCDFSSIPKILPK